MIKVAVIAAKKRNKPTNREMQIESCASSRADYLRHITAVVMETQKRTERYSPAATASELR